MFSVLPFQKTAYCSIHCFDVLKVSSFNIYHLKALQFLLISVQQENSRFSSEISDVCNINLKTE